MKSYIRLEILRTLRDPFYLFLAVVVPIGFYLLFAGLFGSGPHVPGTLSGDVEIMVANAVYGGIWACLVATGPRLANERSSGWFRHLSLLPISPWKILAGRTLVAILFALPAMLLVYVTAVLTHGVQLPAGEWVGVIVLISCWSRHSLPAGQQEYGELALLATYAGMSPPAQVALSASKKACSRTR